MQSEAGATFLDVCASVEEDVEVETLKWMIDLVQEVSDTPICIDSPSARSCVAAICRAISSASRSVLSICCLLYTSDAADD